MEYEDFRREGVDRKEWGFPMIEGVAKRIIGWVGGGGSAPGALIQNPGYLVKRRRVPFSTASSTLRAVMLASMLAAGVVLHPTALCSQPPEWVTLTQGNSPLPSDLVWALAPDTHGGLWIGTGGGLVKSDGATWTVYTTANSPLPSNEIIRLAMDARGVLWIGTYQGLARFDGTTWIVYTIENSPLPSNVIQALLIDARGTLWAGTNRGLAMFDGVSWTVYGTMPPGMGWMDIYALAVDAQGTLWIGTRNMSLVKFDGQAWTVYDWRNSRLYPDNRIFALSVDKQGNLWMGVEEQGLVRFDGVNWTAYNRGNSEFPGGAYAFAVDVRGTLLIGASNGLAKFDGATWVLYTAENSGLPDKGVSALAFDAYGNLWIGTFDGGLAIYQKGGVILTGVEEDHHAETPSEFTLAQNTPNPFNAAATIAFSVPMHSRVKVTIHDALGQLVRELVDQVYVPGVYRVLWDGRDRAQIPVSSGVYVYRMTTDTGVLTRKLVVVR